MLKIRALSPDDYPHAARIFFCAIHDGTRNVYSFQQRLAWGGEMIDLERWKARLRHLDGFVAEDQGEPIGFMTLDETGYVDLAFVLPSCSRQGVGARLLQAVEARAVSLRRTQLTTNASLTSKPFFEAHGWGVVALEDVIRNAAAFTRCRMQKTL